MKKLCAILLICVFMLGGCGGNTSSDMFAMPEMPEMQRELIETVESVLGGGFDYAEPRSGLNRQSLQLMDLDGDGDEEGIAFLRDITDTYKTIIYIFENTENGFRLFDMIEGSERELYTVSYTNLTSPNGYEIIVEWGADGDGIHPITVYGIAQSGTKKLLSISAKQYSVSDIDGDGANDFLAITKDGNDVFADVYTAKGTELVYEAHIPLSLGGGKILGIKTGKLSSDKNGAFIEREYDAGTVTDVIASSNGEFLNLTPNGVSRITRAMSAAVSGDGIIKIPAEAEHDTPAERMNRTYRWGTVSLDGVQNVAAFTYHDYSKGWYLVMPTSWSTSVAVKSALTRSGETAVRFMTMEKISGDTEEVISAELFTVYVLDGADRKARAALEGRFVVSERDDVIFAASVSSESYLATKIDEAFVKSAFRSIESEWFSEILFA